MTMLLLLFAMAFGPQSSPQRLGTIAGQLRDSTGSPAAGVRVGVTPAEADIGAATIDNLTTTDEAGRFRLVDIVPGRYLVQAGAVAFPRYFPGVTARDQARSVTVVAGQTLAGVDFVVASTSTAISSVQADSINSILVIAAARILGLVRVDDGSALPFSSLWVEINGGERPVSRAGTNSAVGEFSVSTSLVTGKNVVAVTQVPIGYYVKSITFGGADVLNAPLVPSGQGGPIEIVLTKTSPTGTPRCPPGEYKAFAWESIPDLSYLNAAFMAEYEQRGVNVTVTGGAPTRVDLKVIRRGLSR